MRKLFVFIFFLGFVFSSSAQICAVIGKNKDYEKPTSKKQRSSYSTAALAFAITKDAASDEDKVLAIYKWITSNISYDNELRLSSTLQKQFYTSEENVIKKVLERKMALCGGFAFLFKSLCGNVGLSAEVVHGFTKDYSRKVKKNKKPNHTWSAVKLDGQWKLLDITWAIGYGSAKGPDDFWLLTKPSEFIYSHYPEESKWTLLESPISLSEF
jgi:transglutaminase/protease-like cytokinesis protein 3